MNDSDSAILNARKYLGSDSDRLVVESVKRMDEIDLQNLRISLESGLGRELDEFELSETEEHNRDHWKIQFVFSKTTPGEPPNGPCVFVYDDGEIKHYYPM
ncbi:MAG: hypothetical protein GY880_17315 [Planctomycetaceae bacterium]|nr:hypothetical protein [Planctomycetaceae bacterium]